MYGNQKRFSELVLDGANLFSFSHFSCEKLKRFAPFKAVPTFSDGVTTRSYNFFLSIFFLSVYYYNNNTMLATTATYLSSWKHRDNGTPPPRPKSPCWNMTITHGVSANKISTNSWDYCTLFWCSCTKKAQIIAYKTHLLSTSTPSCCL
jgi:hypothetical protein